MSIDQAETYASAPYIPHLKILQHDIDNESEPETHPIFPLSSCPPQMLSSLYSLKCSILISFLITLISVGIHFLYVEPLREGLVEFRDRVLEIQREAAVWGPDDGGEMERLRRYVEGVADRAEKDIIRLPQVQQQPLGLIKYQDEASLREQAKFYTDSFELAKKLFQNSLQKTPNPIIDQLQYFYYNKKYNLDPPIPQKPMCIMSPFKNLLKQDPQTGSFHLFLSSLSSQNYTNFHIYLIDDGSTDGSTETLLFYLPRYPRLVNRVTILRNQRSIGALANRDSTTRRYCRDGDIVVDVDGDDALVGKQVFNFVNRMYAKDWRLGMEKWFIYTNFMAIRAEASGDGRSVKLDINKAQRGICKKIRQYIHLRNSYRTQLNFWQTSELRTYLYTLYKKIPLTHFIDKHTHQYHIQASDRFTMYALVQLAGPAHTLHINQYNYFYYQPNFTVWRAETKSCTAEILFYEEAQARMITPLRPLRRLDGAVEEEEGYSVPDEIVRYYVEKEFFMFQCLKQKWKKHVYQ